MKKCLTILLGLCLTAGSSLAMASGTSDGEKLYRKYCSSCHGNDGAKTPIGSVAIKGQTAEEIHTKLAGYQNGTFGGENKVMMQKTLKKISPEDLTVIEAFIQTFK